MKKLYSLLAFLILSIAAANAQQFTTLFEYPSAPDTCTTLESRCDYSTAHFWDKFNYAKQLAATDDSLLVTALNDYFDIMSHADLKVAVTSVRNLMFKAQTNQKNFIKILDIANRMLFTGLKPLPDDIYVAFAQSAVDATWLPAKTRDSFKDVMRRIAGTKLGEPISNFSYSGPGIHGHINDGVQPTDSALTLLFFTSDNADSPLEATRLSADVNLSEYVGKGYIKVIEVYGGKDDDYVAHEAQANPTWQVVTSKDAFTDLDLRFVPSIILLSAKHVIIYKNLSVDELKSIFQ